MKEKIIKTLQEYSNQHVSGEKLSEKLGVSRTAIWKHINALREEGYEIESVPRKGYILKDSPDLLTAVEIQGGLRTTILGKKIIHFDQIDSTNNAAKDFALQEAKEGTLITAEEQLKGRGRRGREWTSPKGTGIWMSILLRPHVLPSEASKFTLLTAVAVAQAIREVTGLEAKIKWPNDIILNGKKVCGILTEMSAEIDSVNHIIVGIGINVNVEEFPVEVEERAISLFQVKGEKISRQVLVRKILENLEKQYLDFQQQMDFKKVLDDWKDLACTLGQHVRATGNNQEIRGVAVDIKEDGALIIKGDNGKIHEVFSGDVSIRGMDDYI